MDGADDLDIRGGGAVSVDSMTLRDAALGFAAMAREIDDVAMVVGSSGALVSGLPRDAWALAGDLAAIAGRLRAAADRAQHLDDDLRAAAAVYEIVELEARRAVADSEGDAARVIAIERAIGRIVREHPDARLSAAMAALVDDFGWPVDLAAQAATGWAWLPLGGAVSAGGALTIAAGVFGVAQLLRQVGAGKIAADSRLRANPSAVSVTPLSRSRVAAPRSLAETAARIPGGGAERVRVERYGMPDGSRQFVVYVAGTQSAVGMGGADPFDALSNLQLYAGTESASYHATREALRASGAEPGDVVHQVAHSQGAMVTAHIALEGGFDAQTMISFGSPVEADLGDASLAVSVRHTDDPVAALQGGGHAQAVGAPGSFIAEREADPVGGVRDLALPAHAMTAYIDTARLLDGSTDPRMEGVRALLDELGTATSVTAVDYGAERVLPKPQPRPRPNPVSPGSFAQDGG